MRLFIWYIDFINCACDGHVIVILYCYINLEAISIVLACCEDSGNLVGRQ